MFNVLNNSSKGIIGMCLLRCINVFVERRRVMSHQSAWYIRICFTCHQRPERSFHYKGKPLPLCARCTGLAVGYCLSFITLLLLGFFSWWWILLLILPMLIDGTGQFFGRWTSNNLRRFLTGMPAGIGLFYILFNYIHLVFSFGYSFASRLF